VASDQTLGSYTYFEEEEFEFYSGKYNNTKSLSIVNDLGNSFE
jgi:hypothetical protein